MVWKNSDNYSSNVLILYFRFGDDVTLKTPLVPEGGWRQQGHEARGSQVNQKSFFTRRSSASDFPWIEGCLMVTKQEISNMEVSLTGGCLPELLLGSGRSTLTTRMTNVSCLLSEVGDVEK